MRLTVAQPCVVTSVLTQRDGDASNSGPWDRLAPDLIAHGLVTCTMTDTQYAGVRVPTCLGGQDDGDSGWESNEYRARHHWWSHHDAPCTSRLGNLVARVGWDQPRQERHGCVPWTE